MADAYYPIICVIFGIGNETMHPKNLTIDVEIRTINTILTSNLY